jgi:HSP20 family molecular chaperone IbpA
MPRSAQDVLWSRSLAVLARADRLQLEVFRPSAGGWEPPVDILETDSELLVVIALPGVRQDDIEIVLSGGELSVMGTRRWPILCAPMRVHRVEMPHGRFERRLPLPAGSFQLVAQELTDGCLLLTLGRLG